MPPLLFRLESFDRWHDSYSTDVEARGKKRDPQVRRKGLAGRGRSSERFNGRCSPSHIRSRSNCFMKFLRAQRRLEKRPSYHGNRLCASMVCNSGAEKTDIRLTVPVPKGCGML